MAIVIWPSLSGLNATHAVTHRDWYLHHNRGWKALTTVCGLPLAMNGGAVQAGYVVTCKGCLHELSRLDESESLESVAQELLGVSIG